MKLYVNNIVYAPLLRRWNSRPHPGRLGQSASPQSDPGAYWTWQTRPDSTGRWNLPPRSTSLWDGWPAGHSCTLFLVVCMYLDKRRSEVSEGGWLSSFRWDGIRLVAVPLGFTEDCRQFTIHQYHYLALYMYIVHGSANKVSWTCHVIVIN